MKIISSRRTIHSANLQASLMLDKPYTVLPNTTLNEKFEINADVGLIDDETPRIKYYTIGRGGHRNIPGSDGSSNPAAVPQFSSHSALYKHLPFVMRKLDDDIGEAERAKYGLRKVINRGGIDYATYYLKRLDMADVVVKVEHEKVVDGGDTTSINYVPKIEDLSPVPVAIPVGTLPTAGDSLTALATVPLVFDEQDVIECKAACAILYGDESYALISEIGICSGVDRPALSPSNTDEINVNEAMCVQILSMISCYQALAFQSNGFEMDIDVGSAEPLSI